MFEITPEIKDKLERLQAKYDAMGQDMEAYLEGLLHSKFLTYWDYIQLETLLSLQKPRTEFPDEQIFIIYHQITELYFKLIQQEIDPLKAHKSLDSDDAIRHLKRINNYFRHLSSSFDVMTYGMDKQQFLNFRMALLPASGFQTVQYREIEIKMTSLYNLTAADEREQLKPEQSIPDLYKAIYWKKGNREEATGKKTLTLRMFENKYDERLMALANDYRDWNIWQLYQETPEDSPRHPQLTDELRKLDLNANVFWRLSHYKSAARYLIQDPDVIKATGGTNWQQYLPPRFQRIVFFPGLWTQQQLQEWGKSWVQELFQEAVEGGWETSLRSTQGDEEKKNDDD